MYLCAFFRCFNLKEERENVRLRFNLKCGEWGENYKESRGEKRKGICMTWTHMIGCRKVAGANGFLLSTVSPCW